MADRILLFGGTFDPVHHGHLIVARSVAEQCGYERVVLIPSARPPHKTPAHAEAPDRLAMLRLAAAGEDLFEVSDIELSGEGASYTINTLEELARRGGERTELNLLIGADMLADLPNWHRSAEVVALARIVVAARPPWQERTDEILRALRGRLADEAVDRLAEAIVPTPLIDISSTEVRRRVAGGLSIRFLVPEAVAAYISHHGLYGA